MTAFSPEARVMLSQRSGGLCEVCNHGAVTEYHHRRPRGMGGTEQPSTGTASNGLACCHYCHRLIESHRKLALLLGWLVPATKDPLETPALVRGQWSWLNDNGSIEPCTEVA